METTGHRLLLRGHGEHLMDHRHAGFDGQTHEGIAHGISDVLGVEGLSLPDDAKAQDDIGPPPASSRKGRGYDGDFPGAWDAEYLRLWCTGTLEGSQRRLDEAVDVGRVVLGSDHGKAKLCPRGETFGRLRCQHGERLPEFGPIRHDGSRKPGCGPLEEMPHSLALRLQIAGIVWIRFHPDRELLDDLQSVPLESDDLLGIVGQQSDGL